MLHIKKFETNQSTLRTDLIGKMVLDHLIILKKREN